MKINKAVIAVAGFGTRSLPVSKTIQKEMFPVVNRPVIDYLVEDLVKTGIKEIIFVVNEHNKQVLHYYRKNNRLREYLEERGKADLYQKVKDLHTKANFHFVKQTSSDPYGTAVPVMLAKEHLENEEAFIVLMGDDIPYQANGSSEVKGMLDAIQESGADALATFVQQEESQLHRYGIAAFIEKNGKKYLSDLIEKPESGTAPSNLANISKYILTPDVFKIIEKQKPNPKTRELYITDTVVELSKDKDVLIYEPSGEYLDCGYPLGWLKANLRVAKDNPQIRAELKKYLVEIRF